MHPTLERATHFLQIDRHDLAEKELRQILVQTPDDALAKALLSRALSGQDRLAEARQLAEEAVAAAPDRAFTHNALAHARSENGDEDGALAAIDDAITLDPDDADLWASRASFLCAKDRWQEALADAERGLSHDPQNPGCRNLAGMCLQMLGRRDEAAEVTQETLQQNPDSAFAHANRGWVHLRQKQYREAEEHFHESLRIKPGNEWAREGVITAIKARHVVYRGLLQFWLWLSTKSSGVQLIVVLALVFGRRITHQVSEDHPEWKPLMMLLGALLLIFVLLTWIGDPLFNLTLRFHPLGRMALTRRERLTANLVGLLLFGGVLGVVLPFLGVTDTVAVIGLGLIAFTIPLSRYLRDPENRKVLGVTVLLGLVGLGAVVAHFSGASSLASTLMVAYLLGVVGFTWLFGFLSRR